MTNIGSIGSITKYPISTTASHQDALRARERKQEERFFDLESARLEFETVWDLGLELCWQCRTKNLIPPAKLMLSYANLSKRRIPREAPNYQHYGSCARWYRQHTAILKDGIEQAFDGS